MAIWLASAVTNTGGGVWSNLTRFIEVTLTIVWDTGLTLLNTTLPRKAVTAKAWPPYVPRKETDSRSPCPALNALAAHGIFPHDGRGIKFTEMAAKVYEHYNFAPSFCFYVSSYMARVLHRNYFTDTCDLSDLCVHNGIEYDASITRYDTHHQSDQSIPAEALVHAILAESKDGKTLTPADFSRIITNRRSHSKATNPQFSMDAIHTYFGPSNAGALLTILGGDVASIRPFLLEERIPDGWTSSIRSRFGLTMAVFNFTTLRVLLGVDPKWKTVKMGKNV